jgi:hypothetical protein
MSMTLLGVQTNTYPVMPKIMQTLQRLHDNHVRIATKNIKLTEGVIIPRLVAVWDTKHEVSFINLPWENPEEKVSMLGAVRALFNTDCPDRYTFASEVWVASGDQRDAEGNQIPPSDRPDHRDALIIISVDRHQVLANTYPVVTTCGKRIVGEGESMNEGDFEGRLTSLMKPLTRDRTSIFSFERRR